MSSLPCSHYYEHGVCRDCGHRFVVFPACAVCHEPIYSGEPFTKYRWEWMLWEHDIGMHDRCKTPQPEVAGVYTEEQLDDLHESGGHA